MAKIKKTLGHVLFFILLINTVSALELFTYWNPFTQQPDYYRGSNFSGENFSAASYELNDTILYDWTEAGVWDKNGTDIYYTDGNVGIGTSTPATNLDVQGRLRAKDYDTDAPSDGAGFEIFYDTAGFLFAINRTSSPDELLPIRFEGSPMEFWTGTTLSNDAVRMYIDEDGNVGIGTTSPATRLHIDGGDITINDTFPYLLFNTNDGQQARIGYVNGGLSFWNGTTALMHIDTSGTYAGNVGIGTTAPTAPLDVKAIAGYGTLTGIRLENSANSNLIATIYEATENDGALELRKGSSQSVRILADGDSYLNGGNVGIGTTAPTNKLGISGGDDKDTGPILALGGDAANQYESGRIRFKEYGSSITNYQGGYIHYDGDDNRLHIGVHNDENVLTSSDTNAISITRAAGYVGIGTTSPDYTLDVNGTLRVDDTALFYGPAYFYNTTYIVDTEGLKVNSTISLTDLTNAIRIVINATDTDSVSYFNAGNVGIGTTAPGTLLHIGSRITSDQKGNLFIQSDTDNFAIHIEENAGSGESWQLGVDLDGNLNFHDSTSATPSVTFQDNGNVGIGTTAPDYDLQIAAADTSTAIAITDADSKRRFAINGLASGGFIMYDGTAAAGSTWTAGITQLAGNVGIGTTTPAQELHINASSGNSVAIIESIANQWTGVELREAGVKKWFTYNMGNSADKYAISDSAGTNIVKIENSGTADSLYIKSDGNVGIGTTTPAYLLDVDGNASADSYYGSGQHLDDLELTENLTLYLPFQAGSPLKDFSGEGNDGTNNEADWVYNGGYNELGAYSFNGASDYIFVGDTGGNFEGFSCWFYNDQEITNADSFGKILNFGNYTSDDYGYVGFGVSTSLVDDELITVLDRNNDDQYRSAYSSAVDTIAVGWHHLAIYRTGDATNYAIYLDNVRVDNDYNKADAPVHAADAVILGARYGSATPTIEDYFDGKIDEFKIWNRTITEEEIDRLYNMRQTEPYFDSPLFIDHANGRVGIGTTSPQNVLDINSTYSNTAFGGGIILRENSGNDYKWGQRLDTGGDLNFDTIFGDSYYSRVTIERSGNVGIGATAPQQKLEVNGSNAEILLQESSTEFVRLGVEATGGDMVLGWDDADDMHFGLFSSPTDITVDTKMIIQADGNVGIGTTTPAQKLTVVGDGNITGDLYTNRVYQKEDFPHMYGLANAVQTVASGGVWYNVTFNESISIIEGNLSFKDMQVLIINETGDYLINFGVEIQDSAPSPSAQVATRIAKNGAQLQGSYAEYTTRKQNADNFLTKTSYAELTAGDKLAMQYISSDTTVTISSASTYNTGVNAVAFGYIQRID